MFTNLLPLFATTVALIGTDLAPEHRALDRDCLAVTSQPAALPTVTAKLYISNAGNGNYLVVIDGHSSAANAAVGVRVYGDDPWFDDFLFSIVGFARTDFAGNFNVSKLVSRSILNEDWEGEDEIYAVAEVSGGGSVRTNTISRSF